VASAQTFTTLHSFNGADGKFPNDILKRALSIDPYDAAAYDLMGRVLSAKNEMSMALDSFQKATHLRPGYCCEPLPT
jgi:Tfp pilus assembly protein PilF